MAAVVLSNLSSIFRMKTFLIFSFEKFGGPTPIQSSSRNLSIPLTAVSGPNRRVQFVDFR